MVSFYLWLNRMSDITDHKHIPYDDDSRDGQDIDSQIIPVSSACCRLGRPEAMTERTEDHTEMFTPGTSNTGGVFSWLSIKLCSCVYTCPQVTVTD